MTKALTVDEAAIELRKTKRWLKDWLKANPVDEAGIPFYIPLGRSKTFEPSDIARIRAHIRRGEQCRLKSIGVQASGIVEAQLAQMAVESVLGSRSIPKTRTRQRARLPRSKRNTGTVISMVQPQS
ncbi:hypothetical protein [Bradyrhizobium elkanii]|uniref:hypothetical protein n=1 Tax=Bradyrhizobium elkanii TaxID=29448 RepID=UPI00216A7ABF|nr:hypothetical protein [Bradyrhizobium elkanii]MCS3692058.1 cobalamin biosynthesis protein CbiG [Bradyrhizobium elkanii]